jgi:hypothetical protein
MDSYSHAWTRQGGVLDKVSKVKSTSRSANDYTAWNDEEVSKVKTSLAPQKQIIKK